MVSQMVNSGSLDLTDSNTLTAVVGTGNTSVLSSVTDAMVSISL
jgi:hypothetical protein